MFDSIFLSCALRPEKVGPDEADDFLTEIAMMKHVGKHENIVAMLGCVTLHQVLDSVDLFKVKVAVNVALLAAQLHGLAT